MPSYSRADAVSSPTLDAYLLTSYLLTCLLNYSLTCGRQERPAPNTYLLTYSLTCIPTYLLMTYLLTYAQKHFYVQCLL